MAKRTKPSLLLWLVATVALGGYFSFILLRGEDKTLFLIGEASHGHHQIELACAACHGEGFTNQQVMQEACVSCHGDELQAAQDSHPKSKFTDPRNADRIEIIDARYCISCHAEHQAENTQPMGLTLPGDYCFSCHQEVAEDRPSHEGLGFDTCASAGCHNYHDNLALYEDFLVNNGHGADFLEVMAAPATAMEDTLAKTLAMTKVAPPPDARPDYLVEQKIVNDWAVSGHGISDINCSDCHSREIKNQLGSTALWKPHPDDDRCASCHQFEHLSFTQGKHGMRQAESVQAITELAPMKVGDARIPMKTSAVERQLSCVSCHGAHDFDRRQASIESCLGCHNDGHSLAYKGSGHYRSWLSAVENGVDNVQGVSCATCHLPRLEHKVNGAVQVVVNHNQSHNLRPNEKMIRQICMDCHGLGFSINALADPDLVQNNFNAKPSKEINSIPMAMERAKN